MNLEHFEPFWLLQIRRAFFVALLNPTFRLPIKIMIQKRNRRAKLLANQGCNRARERYRDRILFDCSIRVRFHLSTLGPMLFLRV